MLGNEKPLQREACALQQRTASLAATREKLHTAMKTQHSQKKNDKWLRGLETGLLSETRESCDLWFGEKLGVTSLVPTVSWLPVFQDGENISDRV